MTGSLLVLIVTPIVAIITLACWLSMIFWAEAHPRWKAHNVSSGSQFPDESPALADDLETAEPAPSHQEQPAA